MREQGLASNGKEDVVYLGICGRELPDEEG